MFFKEAIGKNVTQGALRTKLRGLGACGLASFGMAAPHYCVRMLKLIKSVVLSRRALLAALSVCGFLVAVAPHSLAATTRASFAPGAEFFTEPTFRTFRLEIPPAELARLSQSSRS